MIPVHLIKLARNIRFDYSAHSGANSQLAAYGNSFGIAL